MPKPPSGLYARKNAESLADKPYNINKILGIRPGLNTQPRDGGVLTPTSHGVEVVDLTCLDGINDEIGDSRGSGGGRGCKSNGDNDFFCFQNERGNVRPKQSEPLGKMDAERRDKPKSSS